MLELAVEDVSIVVSAVEPGLFDVGLVDVVAVGSASESMLSGSSKLVFWMGLGEDEVI